jgi:hypothetical protein
MINKYNALVFCLFLHFFTQAQETAQMLIPITRIETGDSFLIKIMVSETSEQPEKIDFSVWNEFLPQKNLLHQSDWTLSGKIWLKEAYFIAFDEADLKLPALSIVLKNKKILKTPPSEIGIFATKSSDELSDMADNRDIVRHGMAWLDYLPWMLGALILSLLLLFFLKKKPKPKVIETPVLPSIPKPIPTDILNQKLALLHQKNLWQNNQQKEYCAELSLIIREYLENQYHFPALESTTAEIMQQLKNKEFPLNKRPILKAILEQSDLAKYAKYIPLEILENEKLLFGAMK